MLTFFNIFLYVVMFYVILALSIFVLQGLLVYRPKGGQRDPKEIGLSKVEELKLNTPDGQELVAWYAPAEPGYPTFIYYHGAIGSLATRRDKFHRITRRGYGLFVVSYRGYSGSTGRPNQGWLTCDSLMAYDYLRKEIGIPADEIIIYGESIGTGIAIPVATARDSAALILEAPYTSIVDIGYHRFPYLPIERFFFEKYRSSSVIKRVKVPTFVFHGKQDKDIPFKFGKALYDEIEAPKRIKIFEEGAHTGMYNLGAFNHIEDFIQEHVGTPKSATVTPLKKSAAE